MHNFICKDARWVQKTAPSWTEQVRNTQKAITWAQTSTSFLTSTHALWAMLSTSSCTTSVWFQKTSFIPFTITHKLQPVWCLLPLANFWPLSRLSDTFIVIFTYFLTIYMCKTTNFLLGSNLLRFLFSSSPFKCVTDIFECCAPPPTSTRSLVVLMAWFCTHGGF